SRTPQIRARVHRYHEHFVSSSLQHRRSEVWARSHYLEGKLKRRTSFATSAARFGSSLVFGQMRVRVCFRWRTETGTPAFRHLWRSLLAQAICFRASDPYAF